VEKTVYSREHGQTFRSRVVDCLKVPHKGCNSTMDEEYLNCQDGCTHDTTKSLHRTMMAHSCATSVT
jgi:hypothetical protein